MNFNKIQEKPEKKVVKIPEVVLSLVDSFKNSARGLLAATLIAGVSSCGADDGKKINSNHDEGELITKSVGFMHWGGKQLGKQEAFIAYSFDKPVSKIVITKDETGEVIHTLFSPEITNRLTYDYFLLDKILERNVVYVAELYDADGNAIPDCRDIVVDSTCVIVTSKRFGFMDRPKKD